MVTANSTCVLDECEYMWHITDGFRFVLPARFHSRYKIFFPDSTLLFMWADADEMQTPVLTATNNGGARYSSTRAIHAISVWVRSIFNGCCENIYICMKKPGDAIYLYWLRMRLDGTQTQRTRCHKFVTTWQQNTRSLSQEWEWESRVIYFIIRTPYRSRENFISALSMLYNDSSLPVDPSLSRVPFHVCRRCRRLRSPSQHHTHIYIKIADEWNDTFLFYCLFGEFVFCAQKCILKSVHTHTHTQLRI